MKVMSDTLWDPVSWVGSLVGLRIFKTLVFKHDKICMSQFEDSKYQ